MYIYKLYRKSLGSDSHREIKSKVCNRESLPQGCRKKGAGGVTAPPINILLGGAGIAFGHQKMIGYKKIIQNYCKILETGSI
jgi:hypothetical protein